MTSVRVWMLVAVMSIVAVRVEIAEACACCDAKFVRTPIGWSDEGAILIDSFDSLECEHERRLETWNVDGQEPTICYDLYGDPDKEISCRGITKAAPNDKWKKTSAAAKKKFAKPATKLAASKFRVTQSWKDPGASEDLNVVIELKTKTGWASLWSGAIQPTNQTKKVRLDVSVWPNPKGDRVLVLVGYVETGTGNRHVDVHWAPMPK